MSDYLRVATGQFILVHCSFSQCKQLHQKADKKKNTLVFYVTWRKHAVTVTPPALLVLEGEIDEQKGPQTNIILNIMSFVSVE